jgi:GNAT superfamily N-acetyltransferase
MNKPPERIRVTKLQEAQVNPVVVVDAACKEAMHRAGVPAADCPARGLGGIVKLTKLHNVLVADADGVVVGYAAWRDESPGVAYLEDMAVSPQHQRTGVGRHLLDAVRAEARAVPLPVLVTRCWTQAASARAFLAKAGLVPAGDQAGERFKMWREEQEAGGALVKEGQVVLVQALA